MDNVVYVKGQIFLRLKIFNVGWYSWFPLSAMARGQRKLRNQPEIKFDL